MVISRFREAVRAGCVDPHWYSCLQFGKPDPPPPPDYAAAARAQGGANVQSAIATNVMNRPTEVTPYGTRSWSHTGDFLVPAAEGNNAFYVPQYTSTTALTPTGQARFDQEQRIIGNLGNVAESGLSRVGSSFAKPFDFASANDARDRAESALFSRLEPKLAQDRESLRTQLINTGHREGTEGYGRAMKRADEQATDARLQVINAAAPERDRMVQLAAMLRNQPLNELNALRTGSQVSLPQFQPYATSNVQPAPIFNAAQAQYGANQAAYNAEAQQNAATMQGLGQLAGTAGLFMFSDRRLKSNVVRVGTHPLGIGIYEYDILGRREMGVMADEVETVLPAAVMTGPDGYKRVNYGAL